MKLWMKALVWLGLGGGIGFFAGYRVGQVRSEAELAEIRNHLNAIDIANDELHDAAEESLKRQMDILKEKHQRELADLRVQYEEALAAQRRYFGEKDDEVICDGQTEMDLDEDPDENVMEEAPEMPDDVLDDIEPFHPQDILPYAITMSEYKQNESGYDQIELDYYTDDGVIFDPRREEKWTRPEQLLGIGWKTRFISNGDKPVREIYIKNDTMECLYKITRIDDSFERLYEEE